jgi:tetratricopeptide (TPR) repeat protein
MAFIALGLADILKSVLNSHKRAAYIFLTLIAVYFGAYTYTLNKFLWHDEKTFFEQEVHGFNNDFFSGDLAEKYLGEGRYREAEALFRVAIDKYGSQPYNYINYSALLLETGRPRETIEILDKAKDLKLTQRKRGEWFNNMGAALFMLNQKEEGLSHFSKAVSYAPEEVEFWKNFAEAYGIMGEYEKSIAIAEKALRAGHDAEKLLVTIAMGYYNLNRFEKTREIINRIPINIRQKNPNIQRILKSIGP